MKQKLLALRNRAAVLALTSAPVLALADDPTTAETAITAARTAILAIIGVGGVAMVVLAIATVGWSVGAKFIKRLGGRS